MSIAVLRTFVQKLEEEQAAMSNRKVKEHKMPEVTPPGSVAEDGIAEDEAANGDCDMLPNQSIDEQENINEPVVTVSANGQRKRKAPKVLEVMLHLEI